MIFVTVGTQDKEFVRLIKKIDELVTLGIIKDEVIVQAGHTKYNSNNIKILNYIPFNEFNDYLKQADVIISHGGVGSILNGVKLLKPVIAVPRLYKYNEHINDHQIQIVRKMADDGYIIACEDESELEEKINFARTFKPKEFKSNTDYFLQQFKKELNDIL